MQPRIEGVPPGRYAVGVSGGADSVAMLSLLRGQAGLQLHVVHMDHQTRGDASTRDAEFVEQLARRWSLTVTLGRLDEVEAAGRSVPPANPSARYRAARLALYGRVVKEHSLAGVLLAHHADDQAETILQRLLRGSGPAGLVGMREQSHIGGLLILRPLLQVRGNTLREYLRSIGQDWREDASNRSDAYFRNTLRRLLAQYPQLVDVLLRIGDAMAQWVDWARDTAPRLGESFATEELADLPEALAVESARKWLLDRGSTPRSITPAAIEQLRQMAGDAATPPRRHFPGGLRIARRGRRIRADGQAPATGG